MQNISFLRKDQVFSFYKEVFQLEVKHNNVNDFSSTQLKLLLNEREYRYLIEFLLVENTKGENGLLFKTIIENCSKIEEEFVKKEIEKMNESAGEIHVWKEPALEKYKGFKKEYEKLFKQTADDSIVITLFILMTLNYVFISYKNTHFRKFLGVKKRGLFSRSKVTS